MRLHQVADAHDQRQLWAAAAVQHVRRGPSLPRVHTSMPRGSRSTAAGLRVVNGADPVRLPLFLLQETGSHSGRSDNLTSEHTPLYHFRTTVPQCHELYPFCTTIQTEKVQKRVRTRVKGECKRPMGLVDGPGNPSTYKIQVLLDSVGSEPTQTRHRGD